MAVLTADFTSTTKRGQPTRRRYGAARGGRATVTCYGDDLLPADRSLTVGRPARGIPL